MRRPPDVYYLTQRTADVPKHNNWLTASERATLATRRILKRRADWRLGRWTAKSALLAYLASARRALDYCDIEIRAEASGAPAVFIHNEPAPVCISISHSNGVGLCVVARRGIDVGCDAERVEPRSDRFVSDFFSPGEREAVERVASRDRARVATLTWSAKESVLKVLREGLRRDTRSVVVNMDFDKRAADWNPFTASCNDVSRAFDGWWQLADGYAYTVAFRRSHRSETLASRR